MKNLNMLSLFKGLLFCLAVILSSCAKDNKKTPISNGGGEYGGGDVILEKATQEDIVNTIPKVKAILPYNLHYLEYMLKGFENVTENQIKSASADTKVASQQNRNFILTPTLTDKIDQYKITILHYKNLGQILFSRNNEKKQNAYELLKNIKILTPTNKACKDSKGNEKDGSVHTLQKGDICISPLRLSNKLKKVHLFNSLLGLVLHEIVHRLGGDKVEAEAKLAEYIVRNTPESYASLFFAEDLKSSTQELILQVSDLLDSLQIDINVEDSKQKAYSYSNELNEQLSSNEKILDDLNFDLEVANFDLSQLPQESTEDLLEEDESTQCERSRLNNQIELLKSNISSQESYIKTLETSINDFSEQLKVFETTLDLNSLICMNLSMVFSTARNLFNHSMGNGIVPILTLGKKEFPLTFAIINQATYSQYYCADIGKYTDDKFEHEEYLSLSHLFENPEFNHSWFEREEIKVFKTNYQNKDHLKRAMNNLLELSKTILQGLTSK